MKLQILIPQYKETDEIIKSLLDSIELQQNIDFNDIGVIIVNDGSDVRLSESLLKSYSFNIEYHINEHKGVSATRNKCLDLATADYVMFCDADDMFYNMCGLWIIFREIDNGGFDTLSSLFIEETRIDGKISYINREKDTTFVHGKVHKRNYLLQQNIRWNEKLTIHEDSYFNILCQSLSANVKYTTSSFYLWKWRDDSVCRNDLKYILKTYTNMLDSSDALIDEFMRRRMLQSACNYATAMIFDVYYTMNKQEWLLEENKEYRDKSEKRFKEYFLKNEYLFKQMTEQEKIKISNEVRNRIVNQGMLLESITFNNWINHIKEL